MQYGIERNPQWDRTDGYLPGKEFFVYILHTRYGHYVGHTGNLSQRLHDHTTGKVQSTYGGHPRLIWKSRPLRSRDYAAKIERGLKLLRDQRDAQYTKLINVKPVPWRGAWATAKRRRPGRPPHSARVVR